MIRYLVLSTKRSSHHAFIEFLLGGESYTYHNDCMKTRSGWRISSEMAGGDGSDVYLASFERNYNYPEAIFSPAFEEKFGDPGAFRRIIFLRDPINTLASSYSVYLARLGKKNETSLRYVIQNMGMYKKLLNYVSDQKLPGNPSDDEIFVYANAFWSDPSYRASVEEWLGKPISVNNQVSKFAGGGHTFFQNDAVTAEDLMTRFEKFRDDETFLWLVNQYRRTIRSAADSIGDPRVRSALASLGNESDSGGG